MSATAADPSFEGVSTEPIETRFKRMRLKARRASRKLMAKTKTGAERVWSFTKRASKTTAVGVTRGISYLALAVSWVVRAALILITAVVVLIAVLLMLVVFIAVGLATGLVVNVTAAWTKYVHGTIAYVAHAAWRTTGYHEYLQHRDQQGAEKVDGFLDETLYRTRGRRFAREEESRPRVRYFDMPLWQNGMSEKASKRASSALRNKIKTRVRADLDNPMKELPDVDFHLEGDDEEMYGDPRTEFKYNSPLLRAIDAFEGDAVSFVFIQYLDEPDLVPYFQLKRNMADNLQEKAYWIGRLEMYHLAKREPALLTAHGRAWSLIWNRYKNQQNRVPLAALRTGVRDMVWEMQEAEASIGGPLLTH